MSDNSYWKKLAKHDIKERGYKEVRSWDFFCSNHELVLLIDIFCKTSNI